MFRFFRYLFFAGVFLSTYKFGYTQDTMLNKYGIWVINNYKVYKKTVMANEDKQMVSIKKVIPTILLSLKYATTDNFMKLKLYKKTTTTLLRKPAVDSLKKIESELNILGLGLIVYDAYRPYSITEKMWATVQDDRYAANPKTGSGHNRGTSIDLSIANLKTKVVLDMGTGFDNFSDTAHHTFINLPKEVLQNRNLLKTIMEKHGFKALETEWWHYSFMDAQKYELLDLTFKQLIRK